VLFGPIKCEGRGKREKRPVDKATGFGSEEWEIWLCGVAGNRYKIWLREICGVGKFLGEGEYMKAVNDTG
jgi:hypothetical protein